MKRLVSQISVFTLLGLCTFIGTAISDPIVITDDVLDRMSATSSSDETVPEPYISQPSPLNPAAAPKNTNEVNVVISDEVKNTWKAVRLAVTDNEKQSTVEYEINIGDEIAIPDSGLNVAVRTFVPAFVMNGLNITSGSNNTDNPAVNLTITENGNEVFRGWIFQKYPTTHTFTHPRFTITLAGEVRN